MRPSMIWTVASKELLSTFRDRRAIVSSLLIPLLVLPVIMLGLPFALASFFEREDATVSEVAVAGLNNLPQAMRAYLERDENNEARLSLVEIEPSASLTTLVQEDHYPVVLEVPASFSNDLAGNKATLKLYSKQGNVRAELIASKVQDAVDTFRTNLVSERLKQAGLDESVLRPVTVETIDASSQAERSSGFLAWLIPFFIAVWALAGGQVAAIDATAGEKERGTLEPLLTSPVRRAEVVVGKFLATLTFGLIASLMAIVGYVVSGLLLRQLFSNQLGESGDAVVSTLGGSLEVNALNLLILILTALFLAALIASLLIGITMFARSFKEAQSYVAPLSFLFILPAIGLQLADFFGNNPLIYLVPILNALLLMNDTVKGRQELLPILFTWLSLLAFTALLLDFAYRSFRRESVIFRT
jgi:sodium transport system permease protein